MPLPSRVFLGLTLATLAAASGAAGQQLTAADRARAVATLWSEARYNFAHWDRVGGDWDSALTATLTAANAGQSDLQFYRLLRRMAVLLNDGHTQIVPAPAVQARVGRPPLLVRAIEGRPFILDYAENDEMRVARPERLAEILSVQGIAVDVWIRDSILPITGGVSPEDRWQRAVGHLLEGPRGTAVQLQLRLPGGAIRGASVTRSVALTERWPLARPAVEIDTLADRTVWVRLNSFEDPDVTRDFDRAFPDFGGVAGLILDLRENDAGAGSSGTAILARLTARPFPAPRWSTPLHRAVPFTPGPGGADPAEAWYVAPLDSVWPRPDRPAFAGPIAVLASVRTSGPAEEFVVAARTAQRGVVIGERTAGDPGRTLAIPLPRGWRFIACVTRSAFPDGTEFGVVGIVPEQRVEVTVADVLAGRDAALERARAYLTSRR
jgi:peptidase S41-like protein